MNDTPVAQSGGHDRRDRARRNSIAAEQDAEPRYATAVIAGAPPDAATAHAAARLVADHLGSHTYQWLSERDLQHAIGGVLRRRFEARPEVVLSSGDRPDFLVTVDTCSVAVEVKIRGARNSILRQIARYATHDNVDAVILAAGMRALLPGTPTMICGKPVVAVHVKAALR